VGLDDSGKGEGGVGKWSTRGLRDSKKADGWVRDGDSKPPTPEGLPRSNKKLEMKLHHIFFLICHRNLTRILF